MDKSRPGAFVSYTDRDPDTSVARRVVDCLKKTGFDVWYFQDQRNIGSQWLMNYQKEIGRRHVLIAIVSSEYLKKPQCRNEVLKSQLRLLEGEMFMAPIFIEPIDVTRLDEDSRVINDILIPANGIDPRQVPSDEELAAFAEFLATCDALREVWSPQEENPPQNGPPIPQVVLPLVERWNTSRSKVLLTLRESAPGAKAVRSWLVRHGIAKAGLNRWEIDGVSYESEIRASLSDVMLSLARHGTEGDARG